MRNFAVLGASALLLALGVAQASAIPSTEQWQDHLSRMSTVTAPYGPPTSATSALRRSTRPRRPPTRARASTTAAAEPPLTSNQENSYA